jgi:hypothetical protein
MEALRAYAQHRGLRIHGTRYDSAWVEGGDDGLLRFSVSTNVDLDRLRKDEKFKSSVIKGVQDRKLDAEPLVRDYLEGLSTVHVSTRKLVDEVFETSSSLVRNAISEFAASSPDGDVLGLNAIKLKQPHTWTQQVPLFDDMIQLIERLRRHNRPMVNLKKRFVTSATEATKPKKLNDRS